MSLGFRNKKFIGIIFIFILIIFIGSSFILNFPQNNATVSKSSSSKEETIDHKENENFVIKWNQTWGGVETEKGNAVAIDSSENIYVAGQTMSFGNFGSGMYDMCLIKYNQSGIQLWNRTWGGKFGENCYAIGVDSDDYVYVAGYTTSFGAGGSDAFLIKYNSSGKIEWSRF